MAAVTFGDAAAVLGHRSRSSLYRLRKAGFLADYLREGGKGGAQLLELEPEGLPPLREYCKGILRARVDSPLWRPELEPEPPPPAPPADPLAFWREWGRVAAPDDPPLTNDEVEENAALIVWHMVEPAAKPAPGCFRYWLWEVEHQAAEARHDVSLGARFDPDRWDATNVRHLLEDLPCDAAETALRDLLEAGQVPAELLPQVRQALEVGQ